MSRGNRRHLVTLAGVGTPTQNAEGEWMPGTAPLTPATWWCSITPATVRDLERQAAGTVVSTATYVLEGEYHPGITTDTQITDDEGRLYYVAGVQDPERRHVQTIVFASERVP